MIGSADGTTEVVTPDEEQIDSDLEDAIDDPFTQGATFQRTLADVTADSKTFNPTMLVLGYSMWGLDPASIARLLNTEHAIIEGIMNSDLFFRTRTELLEAIRYAELGSIHGYLSQKAKDAAVVVASALRDKSTDVKLAAARDVLDRTGFRPADRVEHVHRFDDDLRIVHLTEAPSPDIDIEVN